VLSRLEAGALPLEVLPVDLAEVAEGAVEAVQPLAVQRAVDVRADLDTAVRVLGDTRAIDRVLRNLLDNALRHAPSGSVVTVAVAGVGGAAELRVHDDGPGFPPDFAAHAFDRFSRADTARGRDGGGAGLGLAIARELLRAHGGDVRIAEGPGATIVATVPLDPSTHQGRAG
jgi:signal transduction histidine kinase